MRRVSLGVPPDSVLETGQVGFDLLQGGDLSFRHLVVGGWDGLDNGWRGSTRCLHPLVWIFSLIVPYRR